MTEYSQILVLFLLFPVVVQIILPLGMLVIFGFSSVLKAAFGRQEKVGAMKDGAHVEKDLQLSRI